MANSCGPMEKWKRKREEGRRVPLGLSLMVANAAMNNSTCCDVHIREREKRRGRKETKREKENQQLMPVCEYGGGVTLRSIKGNLKYYLDLT